jgi:hypothetical protein
VRLLLVDLPSLDREEDGGALAAHRAFFGPTAPPDDDGTEAFGPPAIAPLQPDGGATRAVCELIYVPPELPDGPGLLHVIPLPWELGASPVRPIFHPLEPLS